MGFVDASVALRWLLPSQADVYSAALLAKAGEEGLVVPSLWHLEIANQLGLRLRSGKMNRNDVDRGLNLIGTLQIQTIAPALTSPASLISLMERYNLTAYDAVYLDLAVTLKLPLATFDRALMNAAAIAPVQLLF